MLPPSVEEAYRRKCIQLKQRTNEVEEANDAARLRLARLKRQVEKMRLERAFLLEQLAKRTSTNVEDSDGSPSPPPTVRDAISSPPGSPLNPSSGGNNRHLHHLHQTRTGRIGKLTATSTLQPKEKPLRIKRGHRKQSAMPSLDLPGGSAAGATFINQNLQTQSPSSDAFSAQAHHAGTNGLHKGTFRPLKPSSAFELYCDDKRAASKEKAAAKAEARKEAAAEGSGSPEDEMNENENDVNDNDNNGDNTDVEEETLSREWKDLPEERRKEFEDRAERDAERYKKEKDAYDAAAAKAKADAEAEEEAAAEKAAAASVSADAETTDKHASGSKSDTGNKTDDAEGGATAEEMDVDRDADDAETTTNERKASSSAKAVEEATDRDTPRATQEDVEMGDDRETQ